MAKILFTPIPVTKTLLELWICNYGKRFATAWKLRYAHTAVTTSLSMERCGGDSNVGFLGWGQAPRLLRHSAGRNFRMSSQFNPGGTQATHCACHETNYVIGFDSTIDSSLSRSSLKPLFTSCPNFVLSSQLRVGRLLQRPKNSSIVYKRGQVATITGNHT